MPESSNWGHCYSFHGSCNNHWTRAAKEAGEKRDAALQEQGHATRLLLKGSLERGMTYGNAWLQLKQEHPGVHQRGISPDPTLCSYPPFLTQRRRRLCSRPISFLPPPVSDTPVPICQPHSWEPGGQALCGVCSLATGYEKPHALGSPGMTSVSVGPETLAQRLSTCHFSLL